MTFAGSSDLKTALPATIVSAPALISSFAERSSTPPSICTLVAGPKYSRTLRTRLIFSSSVLYGVVPKPGFTSMTTTTSQYGRSSSIVYKPVDGFSTIPARMSLSRSFAECLIFCKTAIGCFAASGANVMTSAPAETNSSIRSIGSRVFNFTSIFTFFSRRLTFVRKHFTTGEPKDIFGAYEEPSCTETCNHSAPASRTFSTDCFKSHKFAFAIDGETITWFLLFVASSSEEDACVVVLTICFAT
mmetsp:Transcript_84/g.237  ORF Transcript_84/g.237 Transcript_84/m.237 type:complete len:245 (-) Transcript_84:217-951(-)